MNEDSEDPGDIKITEVNEATGSLEDKSGPEQDSFGSIEIKPNYLEPEQKAIVDLLRSQVEDLESEFTKRAKARNEFGEVNESFGMVTVEDEDVIRIQDATLKIEDEIVKIKSFNPDIDQYKKVVKDVTEKINQEIIDLKSKVDNKDVVQKIDAEMNDIKDKLENLISESNQKPIEELPSIIESHYSSARKKISNIRHIKGGLEIKKPEDINIVDKTLGTILEEVEKHIGKKITLKSTVGEYEQIPDYIKEKLSLKEFMSYEKDETKQFQHQIVKQGLIIKDLQEKYTSACQNLSEIRDKWFLFQVEAKKNLAPSDLIAAKNLDTEIKKLDEALNGLDSSTGSLNLTSAQITNSVGGKNIKIDPELLNQIGTLSSEEQEALRFKISAGTDKLESAKAQAESPIKEDRSEGSEYEDHDEKSIPHNLNADSEDVNPDTEPKESTYTPSFEDLLNLNSRTSKEDLEEIAQLKNELEIVQVQLENSQSLIEKGDERISELETLLEKSSTYSEQLEQESQDRIRLIESMEDKIEKYQSSEDRFHETMDDADRNIKNSQVDLEAINIKLNDLQEALNLKTKEIESLRKGAKWESLSKAKDEQIDQLSQRLNHKQEEASAAKKEAIQSKTKYSQLKQNQKHNAQKLERMRGEYETLKNRMRSMGIKIEMSNNLLQQSRKAANKLTAQNDSLRKERQKYIRKTNESMAKFKAMMSEAQSLQRKMDAGNRSLDQLQSELDQKIKKEQELLKEVQSLKALVDQNSKKKKAS